MRRLFGVLDASGRFPVPPGEISVAVLDAPSMALLHHAFLQDPSVTDVITFAGDPDLGTAGEITVCADVAQDYASEHGGSVSEEVTLYVVHGYLHLAGFDDRDPVVRRRMRSAERAAMALLRRAGTFAEVRVRTGD